jgi:hypothetical protein
MKRQMKITINNLLLTPKIFFLYMTQKYDFMNT